MARANKTNTSDVNKEVDVTLPDIQATSKKAPTLIPSKQFINGLKRELAGEKISESVFKAFISIVPKVDTSENYQKIWKTTFKRR